MKNSAGRGGCYPPRPKAEFNNCFIIHSKYFQTLKGENELRNIFFAQTSKPTRSHFRAQQK